MASIVLRDVGSAVGNALLPGCGGAFVGTLGRSLGGLVNGQLGLGSCYQGPQLQNLSVQDSRYGAGIPITYGLATLRPFSPANLYGMRASGMGSDLTLIWKRRALLNADWVDYVDVPLDEPTELYDVEIMNGASVMRTFSSVTSPTVTYTASQQTTDWGTVPTTFTINVYQLSSRYGRGQVTTAVI